LSLLRRGAADVIGRCAARGTGVIVYSPMESGLLSGSFSAERVAALPANDWRRSASEYTGERLIRNLRFVDALRPVADRHDVSVAAIAVARTLAWPGVTGAIVGARRPAQVADMAVAAGCHCPPRTWPRSQQHLRRPVPVLDRSGRTESFPRHTTHGPRLPGPPRQRRLTGTDVNVHNSNAAIQPTAGVIRAPVAQDGAARTPPMYRTWRRISLWIEGVT
jgi:hypothetical protein